MEKKKQMSLMEKIASVIVDKRNILFLAFLAAAIFCAFSRNWVQVNDSLTDYLPEDTETRQGLELMEQEFVTFGTAEIMVQNITYEQAQALCEQIEHTDGVKSVEFDDSRDHYAAASALFSVTFDGEENDQVSIDALDEIREKLSAYDLYVSSTVGNPLKAVIDSEMLVVDIIAVVIIGSALALWITWRIARPLRHLRSEVLQIADGNLENRVSEQGPEEIVQVARAVNSMAHTMVNNINSMRKLVADVSHEMRSPLARMNISATIVQEGLDVLTQGQEGGRNPNLLYDAAGTPLACVHIGYILQEIEHMEKLVGSSLLNSRLDFQERMQEAKDVDFSSLCMDIALRHESLFKEKALILNLDIQPLLWVRGDDSLLALIISNLLDNAVKYTDTGGRVLLVLDEHNGYVRLQVENSHPGLSEEVMAHVFEPFFRGDCVDDAPGVGLGLTLVKKIAVRHRGNAFVERTDIGLRVCVMLPLLRNEAAV